MKKKTKSLLIKTLKLCIDTSIPCNASHLWENTFIVVNTISNTLADSRLVINRREPGDLGVTHFGLSLQQPIFFFQLLILFFKGEQVIEEILFLFLLPLQKLLKLSDSLLVTEWECALIRIVAYVFINKKCTWFLLTLFQPA